METTNEMTAERSLEIISRTIEQSRRSMEKNAGMPMVIWGVLVALTALIVGHLWQHNGDPVWNFLWGVFWIFGLIAEKLLVRHKEKVPVSFVGKTISHVWLTFGIFCMFIGLGLGLVAGGFFHLPISVPHTRLFVPVTSFIIAMFGLGSAITGFILRNYWIVGCGLVSGVIGFYVALICPGASQMVVLACVSVVGLVIPGIIVNLQTRSSCSNL